MSIKIEDLDNAVIEAKRFLRAARDVQKKAGVNKHIIPESYEGGKYCAAAKRASMDLSRALASVRNG